MSDNANPWVTGGPVSDEEPEVIPETSPMTRREALRGPSAPQPTAVPVPESADRLPTRQVYGGATMWWVGAHGGAGESTLASLVLGSQPAGHAWPIAGERGTVNRVIVLARTNFSGLMAAQRVAREWAAGTTGDVVDLAGLVLVADAPGRRPKELRQLEQHVAGGYPRAWTLPWVEAWRMGAASAADMPREYRSLLSDLNLTASSN
ncbi:DUF6668 family protein [Curtobacterium sp. VKM Ac-1395]|uniref:DUF6668 family protein n=1 Tax=Curtobacterium sp. VKM Ac-1395 TaxID=2783815 RepID=UPI00188BB466|nr:DUF6668 family protein [Curtobacterium sp. VKM Ac-1395]MBF4592079.1 hypothetical protein [Curtobacterium sp. VKM Ac-1395]